MRSVAYSVYSRWGLSVMLSVGLMRACCKHPSCLPTYHPCMRAKLEREPVTSSILNLWTSAAHTHARTDSHVCTAMPPSKP